MKFKNVSRVKLIIKGKVVNPGDVIDAELKEVFFFISKGYLASEAKKAEKVPKEKPEETKNKPIESEKKPEDSKKKSGGSRKSSKNK